MRGPQRVSAKCANTRHQRSAHANAFPAPCQNRRVAASRRGVGLVFYQGERHLRYRPARDAGRLSFENRRTQSAAGQEKVLTARLRVFYSQNRYPPRIESEGMLLRNTRWLTVPFNQGGSDMALSQSHFQEYDFDRMVVRFTRKNDQTRVACAISTDAMDQLEGSSRTPPAQREQQFLRLRDRIEERAARKFSDVELEGNPPGVILRAIDFRVPLK